MQNLSFCVRECGRVEDRRGPQKVGKGKRGRENNRVNRSRRNDLIREVEILTSIIESATGYDPDN